MTTQMSQIQAVSKIRYQKGQLPLVGFRKFPFTATVEKRTDFTGKYLQVALQNERPQGSSSKFADALGSLQAGSYLEMNITRKMHYGIARITGEAMKAVKNDDSGLIDIWKNECDGTSQTEILCIEQYSFGAGDGVLARTASAVNTTTITLEEAWSVANLAFGMRIQLVSTTGLSPTLRVGSAVIRGVLRGPNTATITFDNDLNILIAGATQGDYIVRAGDYAAGGVQSVMTGLQQLVAGGSAPGTLNNLNRNIDPTRLAGLSMSGSGNSADDTLLEALGMVSAQGGSVDLNLWLNTRDKANWMKSQMGRVTYPRTTVSGKGDNGMVTLGFKAIQVESDNGMTTVMTSPFCPKGRGFLVNPEGLILASMGPAPQLLDWDTNSFLRVQSDDAYEIRFGAYLDLYTKTPADNLQITEFGGA